MFPKSKSNAMWPVSFSLYVYGVESVGTGSISVSAAGFAKYAPSRTDDCWNVANLFTLTFSYAEAEFSWVRDIELLCVKSFSASIVRRSSSAVGNSRPCESNFLSWPCVFRRMIEVGCAEGFAKTASSVARMRGATTLFAMGRTGSGSGSGSGREEVLTGLVVVII